jgi:hypothetical protein
VGLQEEVESERVGNGVVHNGTGGQVTSAVKVLLVDTEEPHVVALGANHEGDLSVNSGNRLLEPANSPWACTSGRCHGKPAASS